MAFKVVAFIPLEFKVQCNSKEEAINTAKEFFKRHYEEPDLYYDPVETCVYATLDRLDEIDIKYEAEEVTND